MARPRKTIDEETLKGLSVIQCTLPEMATVLGVSEKTLRRRYDRIIKEGQSRGHISLKRAMWKKGVVQGNVIALIWLSKNILGWTDRSQVSGSTSVALRIKSPEEVAKEIEDAAAKEAAETAAHELEAKTP